MNLGTFKAVGLGNNVSRNIYFSIILIFIFGSLIVSIFLASMVGFGLNKLAKGYDGVIVAVNHTEYKSLDEKFFKSILAPKGVLVDIKGMYRNKIKGITYWSL
jgi:hypothetical protein